MEATIPDSTPFAPDTLFRKTWRVRNSGTCAWDSSYRLTFLAYPSSIRDIQQTPQNPYRN
jgi:hypothetical protein